MRLFILCCALLVVGCKSTPEPVVSAEVTARVDQLSEILTVSRSSLDSQVATVEAITAQSAALDVISAKLDVLIDVQMPLEVDIEPKEASAYTEAVVVDDESEPVSGKEVIQQSTSTSSLDTVADDGVHFEVWTATWCGPCRRQKPVTVSVSNELGIPVKHWWDWDEYKQYAADSKISELPTLCIVRRGKAWKRLSGPRSAAEIRAAVAEVQSMDEAKLVTSSDDLTIRNKLPVVATKWGLQDLEEVNEDGTCQCERCVALRALRSEYMAKPEYQNIGRKVEPETF